MEEWRYEPAVDLNQSLTERLKNFPRQPDMLQYGIRSVLALAIRAWLRVYHRLEISGRENLPREGSFVLVANHTSHLDTLCLLAALPLQKLHRAFPAAAADYFFVKVPRVAAAVLIVNAFPFHREIHVRQSLGVCERLLANPGNILILFPEGTRSPDGKLRPFKPGIGALLAGTAIPAVPCWVAGAAQAWPKGRWLARPRQVRVVVGKPRSYAALPKDRQSSLEVARDLERAVAELSGG
ncbi:MAG: 1-acyl-sn-glycerol-3-phosphate acyltransferase [Planctomycetes bacterium]|nr:1-acyl-sn-glycerol-3-phosphate acyltransferase [Planctomycetota bacterium]